MHPHHQLFSKYNNRADCMTFQISLRSIDDTHIDVSQPVIQNFPSQNMEIRQKTITFL